MKSFLSSFHEGYFLGSGSNKAYVDGSSIWVDYVDTLTWLSLMVDNLVEEIATRCRAE
jgi:hypothetical protein